MHQQQSRRSKRTTRRREQLNSSSADSSDSSLSRIVIQSSQQTTEHTLPLSIVPTSSTSLMTTAQRTTDTQTIQDYPIAQSFNSKSIPSFAETQLLSVYYLNRNISNQPVGRANQDSCIFIEQQERQPIRFRATYDPLAFTKSTQTSPPASLKQLSTHGSTLIIDANQQPIGTNNRLYEQRLKIHSGSQRLANNSSLNSETDELLSPSELVEESRYSYEEYIIHVDNNQEQQQQQQILLQKQTSSSSPTSTSSVTTIIAQPSSPPPPPPPLPSRTMSQFEEVDSDRTSRLSGDEINTHSSASSMSGSFTNQDWPTATNNSTIVNTRQRIANETTRVSSWPPAPYDIPPAESNFETSFVLDESDEQRRPSRVQFAEQLVHVIPPSATNSLSEESVPPPLPNISAPAIIPRTSTNRTNSYEQSEQQMNMDVEEDDTTTTTTTSSNIEQIPGRLQHPINQSKWVKDHMAAADVPPPTTTTAGRVGALRSLFEQQSGRSSDSSTLNSPTGQIRRTEPEERPSRHGDEIRFRIKELKSSTVHHAEPVKVTQRTKQSTATTANIVAPLTWEDLVGVQEEHQQQRKTHIFSSPFELDEIRQITGKRIKTFDDVGQYLQVKILFFI
jgi:hypothetical protein